VIQTIVIEREYGCGAGAIARKLASRLDWTLWDEKITQEVARYLKCDVKSVEQREEKPDSTFYRLMKIFMRGSYEEGFSGAGTEFLDAESLSRLFERVILDVTKRGPTVIVGRAAPWYLRGRKEVMSVFVFAPYDEKMRRLLDAGKSETEADDLLQRIDADRAAFIKQYYGKNWPQRDLYHLMINSVIGDEGVIDLVLREMEILNKRG
jgi:cytidylate kinase